MRERRYNAHAQFAVVGDSCSLCGEYGGIETTSDLSGVVGEARAGTGKPSTALPAFEQRNAKHVLQFLNTARHRRLSDAK